jgi:hypothetical protein
LGPKRLRTLKGGLERIAIRCDHPVA